MEGPKKPQEYPIGLGEEFQKERRKETLPAVEVSNEVLWVNPAFEGHLPFRLYEGQAANLGVFFKKEQDKLFLDLVYKLLPTQKEKIYRLSIMPEEYHGRSGLLGEIIFQDRDGRLYRDLDIKGVGYFARSESDTGGRYAVRPIEPSPDVGGARGLMDRGYAFRDRDYSEMFTGAGIRTHRVPAIIELKEIIDIEGNKISIAEAKEKKMIPETMRPVLLLRAFGTKERVDYLEINTAPERRRLALLDAIKMVSQEFGLKKELSLHEYLLWFAKTLGEQIAKMRKLGVHHGYLFEHNITLDCRIVDLDSVLPIKEAIGVRQKSEEVLYQSDYNIAKDTVKQLYSSVEIISREQLISKNDVSRAFEEAYQKELELK